MLKISRVPFGVFTANNLLPSGDMAMGRTCPLSNSTKEGPLEAAETGLSVTGALKKIPAVNSDHRRRKTNDFVLICWRTDCRMGQGSFLSSRRQACWRKTVREYTTKNPQRSFL